MDDETRKKIDEIIGEMQCHLRVYVSSKLRK